MVYIGGSLVKGILKTMHKLIKTFIPLNRIYINGRYIEDTMTIEVDGQLLDIEPIQILNYDVDTIIVNDKVIVIKDIKHHPDIDNILELYVGSILNLHTFSISTDKVLYFRESGISLFDELTNFTCEHELITDYLTALLELKEPLEITPTNIVGKFYALTRNLSSKLKEEPMLNLPDNIWDLKIINNSILIEHNGTIHKLHYLRLKEKEDEANTKDGVRDKSNWEPGVYGEEFMDQQG